MAASAHRVRIRKVGTSTQLFLSPSTLMVVIAAWILKDNVAGSRKWQNASKMVSVLLVIAGMGLAFIALVGGNGGPRWSGLVSVPTHLASEERLCHMSMHPLQA